MVPYKSLKEITNSRDVARIILQAHKVNKSLISKPIVLVEGIDDISVYSVFIDRTKIDFKDCNGCKQIRKVHETIKLESKVKFFSIIDSDFQQLEGKKPTDSNMFFTDYHDSEMLMIHEEKVLKSIFYRLCSHNNYVDLKTRIENELFTVSMIRWFNVKRKLYFRFVGLDLSNCEYSHTISFNTALQYFLPTPSGWKRFPQESFEKFMHNNRSVDMDQLTNGHDFISRLAGIIKHEYNRQISDSDLREQLCKAYTVKLAKKTKLFKSISDWCDRESTNVLFQS